MKPPRLLVCVVAAIAFLPATKSQSADPEKPATPTADHMVGKQPGQVRDDNGLKLKLVWCPPGVFTMEDIEFVTEPVAKKENNPNDDDEVDPKDEPNPRRMEKIAPVKVFVTKGYWIGQ